MSVWDSFASAEEGNSLWIKNDYFREPRVLQLVDITKREQREGTPDVYKTPDGMELVLKFKTKVGEEKLYTCRSLKGALPKALQATGIELNDWFEASAQGEGITMTFTVNKAKEDGTVTVEEKSENSF